MTSEIEEAKRILSEAALSLPPPHVVRDLLSSGVCVRCIFRLFNIHGPVYSCSLLTALMLNSFLEEKKSCLNGDAEDRPSSNGLVQCSYTSEASENDNTYCSICLGILQLAYESGQGMKMCKERNSIENFTASITDLFKQENHQIDGFSTEISVPPVIVANEQAIWLYLKRKYDCEEWFRDEFLSEFITVNDAFRLSITSSLQKHLDVKSVGTSHIRFTYTHFESTAKMQNSLGNDHSCKRRKTETESNGNIFIDMHSSSAKDSNELVHSTSDASIPRALDCLQDPVFAEHFVLPPEKVYKPCQLTISCCRTPMYIGGRYLKFSRKVSQSRWIVDDERVGETSVEEVIGSNALIVCRGDSYKFHAAGREDINVRMLGSGRPFLLEVLNAPCMPSMIEVQEIADKINNSDEKYVMVRDLKVVGSDVWALMREGEAEKQKQYAALIWLSHPLTEEDLQNVSSLKNMEILQRTPIRVLHRRSPLERKRTIHWMKLEKISGSCQYFLLHLCTQAGTYIKEFVHGDLGRTYPSIGSIVGCRAEILQLDVTDVKMDVSN